MRNLHIYSMQFGQNWAVWIKKGSWVVAKCTMQLALRNRDLVLFSGIDNIIRTSTELFLIVDGQFALDKLGRD